MEKYASQDNAYFDLASQLDLSKLTQKEMQTIDPAILIAKCEDKIKRAEGVARLLNHVEVKIAIEALEETFIEAWKNSTPLEANKREQLYHVYFGFKRLLALLRDIIDAGKDAELNLKHLQGQSTDKPI